MEMFQFGELEVVSGRYGSGKRGEYALHIQCTWRIVGPQGIIVGSGDLYYPAGDPRVVDENFDWAEAESTQRDQRVAGLLAGWSGSQPVVESVESDDVGSIRIALTQGFIIEVFPDSSLETEMWRLLTRGSLDHFVVTGRGIED